MDSPRKCTGDACIFRENSNYFMRNLCIDKIAKKYEGTSFHPPIFAVGDKNVLLGLIYGERLTKRKKVRTW